MLLAHSQPPALRQPPLSDHPRLPPKPLPPPPVGSACNPQCLSTKWWPCNFFFYVWGVFQTFAFLYGAGSQSQVCPHTPSDSSNLQLRLLDTLKCAWEGWSPPRNLAPFNPPPPPTDAWCYAKHAITQPPQAIAVQDSQRVGGSVGIQGLVLVLTAPQHYGPYFVVHPCWVPVCGHMSPIPGGSRMGSRCSSDGSHMAPRWYLDGPQVGPQVESR